LGEALALDADVRRDGATLNGLRRAALSAGFKAEAFRCTPDRLFAAAPWPCVLLWRGNHFVVAVGATTGHVWISDPALSSVRKITLNLFLDGWVGNGTNGVALLLEPGAEPPAPPPATAGKLGQIVRLSPSLRRGLALAGAFMLASAACASVSPLLARSLIDAMIGRHAALSLGWLLAMQIAVFGLGATLDVVRGLSVNALSNLLSVGIAARLVRRLLMLRFPFFSRRTSGDLLERISDHERIERLITGHAFDMAMTVSVIAGSGISLALIDIGALLGALCGGVAYVGWSTFWTARRAPLETDLFEASAQHRSAELQLVTAVESIKVAAGERLYLKKLFATYVQKLRVGRTIAENEAAQETGSRFISFATTLALTVYCGFRVAQGALTVGDLSAVTLILGALLAPLARITEFSRAWQEARLAFDRTNTLMAAEVEPSGGPVPSFTQGAAISFRKISFAYTRNSPPILTDLTFTCATGEFLAIVGASGGGKSTIVNLLVKLHRPDLGQIFIGERDLESIDNRKWRKSIGTVVQNGQLFDGSVAQNVAMRDQVDEDALWRSLNTACAAEFVQVLPGAENCKVGPNGHGLSGGQRQRLLIARALYGAPPLILLDEATSALDALSEAQVVANLKRDHPHATRIVVAHRLSTIRQADRILVLDKGAVVECGTHDALIRQSGLYASLVREQLQDSLHHGSIASRP